MASATSNRRRRVLVPQALGSDEFLRVTSHRERSLLVFSQWDGDRCVAAIPVRVSEVDELRELMNDAVGDAVRSVWPAPDPARLVVPAAGLAINASRRTA